MNTRENMPLLSVIVTTYRNGDYLFETIDSVLRQDYPNIELLIAEDGAPDFAPDEIERYIAEKRTGNITCFAVAANPQNVGTVQNIRGALKRAAGDYVKIIAGDDLLASESVCTEQVVWLLQHPRQQLVVGNCVECTVQMKPLSTVGFAPAGQAGLLEPGKEEQLLRYLCRDHFGCMATQACCFRKAFFEEHDLPDARFHLIEDLPMAVRILSGKIPFGYFPCDSVLHRGAGGVSTGRSAFDARRSAYYQDILTYYQLVLTPLQECVGCRFVRRRKELCQMRLAMCSATSVGQKLRIVARYMPAIIYYVLTRSKRALFYLSGRE